MQLIAITGMRYAPKVALVHERDLGRVAHPCDGNQLHTSPS